MTRQLTRRFADTWLAEHGSAGYRYRDLAADPVPPIDTAYCQLGRRLERHGNVPLEKVDGLIETAAEAAAWELTRPLIDEVRSGRMLLIGTPMYNFSLPAALKAWIDRITFPGAFADDVLQDTEVVVVTASGGAYGPGTPREGCGHLAPYLRTYFTSYGVREENLTFIQAELTLTSVVERLAHLQPLADRSLAKAQDEVRSVSRRRRPARAEGRPEVETYAAGGG